MNRGPTGVLLSVSSSPDEVVRAFLPEPLPPRIALSIDAELRALLDEALLAIGRLDSITTLLPDPSLFLFSYVRKEAILSSQIEGTQSSLSDLLAFEAGGTPLGSQVQLSVDDVKEVSNYVAAMDYGVRRLRDGFPLSARLLREVHAILLRSGRGTQAEPGEFRRSQNWIGGTRPGNALFVPPPPDRVAECISDLERWLHDMPERTPSLIKAGLAHVQFETIHPFLDGNGRVGRLLVTLLFCAEGMLQTPMLFLSLYLKQHRAEYYALLTRVREDGDWEAWLRFFATGVRDTAQEAVHTVRELVALFERDRADLQSVGRQVNTLLRLHSALQQRPILSAAEIVTTTGLSLPTVNVGLRLLQQRGMVRELTGRRRNRIYSYAEYVRILSEGTEPL